MGGGNFDQKVAEVRKWGEGGGVFSISWFGGGGLYRPCAEFDNGGKMR